MVGVSFQNDGGEQMAFCSNCGVENKDSSRFCKNCGKPLKVATPNKAAAKIAFAKSERSIDLSKLIDRIRQIPKRLIICSAVVFIAAIGTIVIIRNIKPTISLNDYLVIDLSGYDGYGSANVRVDWGKIEKDYGNKIALTKDGASKYATNGRSVKIIDILRANISAKLDKSDVLSNGDQVQYMWDISDNSTAYVNCKLKYSDDSFNVSGLDEIEKFNPFDDLEVEFSGTSPKGTVNFFYSGEELSLFDFKCDKQGTYTLSNGDSVTFTINDSVKDYCAEHYGKIPEPLTKEYIVEGLKSYVDDASEIPEETLTKLKEKAESVFNDSVIERYGNGEEHESLNYIGNYYLTSKGEGYGAYNALYLVYEFKVHNTSKTKREGIDEFDEISTGYWYILYKDIMFGEEGSLGIDIDDYITPRETFKISAGDDKNWVTAHNWYYKGYSSLDDLYNVLVKANGDDYNIYDNIQK